MNFVLGIAGWFGGLWPRVALIAGALAALVAWRAYDVSKHEARGAAKAAARIEKATDNAANLGKRAADKSITGGVRGQRDPTTRND